MLNKTGDLYNKILKAGTFPKAWKKQRLVLLNKGKGDPKSPSAFRPLCMLDSSGKLLEKLLKPRITEATKKAGDLSEMQFGFRKGRSSIDAVQEVIKIFEAAQEKNHYSRKIVVLITFDIKNAFNSMRWTDMRKSLRKVFRMPRYLLRILNSYLQDRVLLYETTEGERQKNITAGAAQGSILGPDLWNITYDGILKIVTPEDAILVGYADDLAAVISARDLETVTKKLNQLMRRLQPWIEEHGFTFAI